MTTVFPITGPSAAAHTSPTDPTTATSGNNQLNENTFLTLLVAQLKYQDPMNPADSTQFLTQTAQFTQVETLQKMEKEQATAQAAGQVLAASTMIGRPVTYSLSSIGGSGTPTPTNVISVRGSLPKDAAVGATATATTDAFTASGARDSARAELHEDGRRLERAGARAVAPSSASPSRSRSTRAGTRATTSPSRPPRSTA